MTNKSWPKLVVVRLVALAILAAALVLWVVFRGFDLYDPYLIPNNLF